MENNQPKFTIRSLRARLMAVSMLLYFSLLAIMYYGVSNFAGVLWATTWADVPPELVAQIQQGGKMLVGTIFLIALPFWLAGSFFLSSRFTKPFTNLSESAQKIKQSGVVKDLEIDEGGSGFTSTAEMTQVKGMLSSMMTTIRENDEQFRSIVSNQRELIFRWRPDFSLTFVNQAFCNFFGGEESYYLQTPGKILEDDMKEHYPELAQLVEGELLIKLEFTNESVDETFLKMPTGETQWVQWRTMALFDDVGNVSECQSIGYVLTDLKRTQLALEEANRQPVILSQELIKNQEEERISVARFLHDQVLGELGELARSPDESVDQKTVQQITDKLRSTIYMMRSPMLNYGLSMALEDLSDHMKVTAAERGGIEFHIDIPKNLTRFDSEVETQIYRIIQEACKNALEHAGAREIRLSGVIDEDMIELMVEDNGSGFEMKPNRDEMAMKHHYGMIGMEERGNIIGANLEIDSKLGKGTRVKVRWVP